MERDKITTNADTGQVAQPDAKHLLSAVCSWCGEQIFIEQPISKSYDGETMHFGFGLCVRWRLKSQMLN